MRMSEIINEHEDFIYGKFIPAPEGTTAEISPGVSRPVKEFLKLSDGQVEIPVIEAVSDYKWQLDCLNSRLKDPERYRDSGEDVEAVIVKLQKWLEEHNPE